MGRSIARLPSFLVLFVVVAAVAACSGSAATPNGAPARAGLTDSSAGGGELAAATAAPSAAPAAPAEGSGGSASTAALVDDTLIIRTGSLDLEVADLDQAILKARASVVGSGGYVSDSQRSTDGDKSMAVITYRIPAARWEDTLDALRALGSKVLGEQIKAVDVTSQVVDIGARIDNLKATERALQAIMVQATKISDILDVQNQLTNVRGEIEQLTAQKNHLSDQASYGTLAVSYTLPLVAVAQATSGWNLGTEIDRAVAQLVQIGQGLAVAAVWFGVVLLPVLLGIGLLVALVALVARRLRLVPSREPANLPTPGEG